MLGALGLRESEGLGAWDLADIDYPRLAQSVKESSQAWEPKCR